MARSPRRLSLSTQLVGLNVVIVVATAVLVLAVSVSLLRRLADEQALARVALAESAALREVQRAHDDLLAAARLLAEQQPLGPLLTAVDSADLDSYLEQFRSAHQLAGAGVERAGRLFARSSPALAWEPILSIRGGGPKFLSRLGASRPLVLGAAAPVPSDPSTVCMLVRPLDESFAKEIGAQIGLQVSILTREQVTATEPEDSGRQLRERALESGETVAERVDAAESYLAVQPLRNSAGEILGIVETRLPAAGVSASVRMLARTLLGLSAAVAALAALCSFAVGRRLARPIDALAESSARIGRGDLATPIPRTAGAETGALAATMDEMRGRLLLLTAELRYRRAEAEAILGGIAEGVFAVDRERRVRYLNPQAAAMLGVTVEDAIGRFCGDLLDPVGPDGRRPCEEDCPIVHARFRGTARATERLRLQDGKVRSVIITSAAPEASDALGTTQGGGGSGSGRQFQVMRDETEQEATRRLRDAVLANISHEFRTPLTAQLASIELLQDRLHELGPAEAAELVMSLHRGTLRLTELVDNLLESVRIEAGEHSIRLQTVRVDEIVEAAVELTAPLLSLRDQKLVVALPYPLPPVTGDPPRLIQVFVNLLANANKFAPAGSTIGVGGEVRDDEIVVWVEDEGSGLSPALRSSLFDRFTRGGSDDEAEPEQSGMGLGLAIVKSIVLRHGGRVEPRSAGADKTGTRMCVILPRGRTKES